MVFVVGELELKILKDFGGKIYYFFCRVVNFGVVGSIMVYELLYVFYKFCG